MRAQEMKDDPYADPRIRNLFRIGGIAGLLAAAIFRRNLGAEIALFSPVKMPADPIDWFNLLQNHRLLGLAYLGIFDLVNVLLIGLMMLAVFAALRRSNPSLTLLAISLGFLGIAVYLASNTAFSMLSLSEQYAAANRESQRAALLAAGQALLALNRFSSSGGHPGSGGYLSLFLIAASGLIFSWALLQRDGFSKPTAYCGILANALDLMYCIAFPFVPGFGSEQLAIFFIPAAGFFFVVWHFMLGWTLLR
jgi:Domain of unknown function (DUF4386)